MRQWSVVLVVLVVVAVAVVGAGRGASAAARVAVASWDEDAREWRVDEAVPLEGASSGCGWATYDNTVNSTGWATLTVHGNSSCSYKDAALAMGYLEGKLSQPLIWDAFVNFNASNGYLEHGHLPPVLEYFINNQTAWMQQQVLSATGNATYWKHVHALLLQVQGIQQGYQAAAPPHQALTSSQVYILAMAADLEDLAAAIPYINASTSQDDVDPAQWRMDCSGLVKVDSNNAALFTGHTTFNAYWAALRVFKHYVFNPSDISTTSTTVSFSSRPGDLHSKDDFFLLSDRMTVVETSLTVFNKTLYKALTPMSVPVWIRAQVANRLATSAQEWVNIFLTHNSGTHNNEWIVTDYKRFAPNRPLQAGTCWMVEQMVMHHHAEDVTPLLERQRYIPSYNIPYFKDIFAISGYGRAGFNYTTDPRAQIFRRDHGKVYDIDSMCKLMNSNNYKRDPLSKGNPCNQISARCDLPDASLPHQQSNGPYAFGGIDSKNVDHSHVNAQRVRAISGMPYEHVPAFVFDEQWSGVAHQGMPHMFKFNWTTMAPAP